MEVGKGVEGDQGETEMAAVSKGRCRDHLFGGETRDGVGQCRSLPEPSLQGKDQRCRLGERKTGTPLDGSKRTAFPAAAAVPLRSWPDRTDGAAGGV